MKRTISAIGGLGIIAASLAGCADSVSGHAWTDQSHSSASSASQAPANPAPHLGTGFVNSSDESFLLAVRQHIAELDSATDPQLVKIGHATCAALAAGNSWEQVVGVYEREGMTPNHAGFMLGAAVGAYCPDQEWRLPVQ